jgi:hypothetical protein
LHDNRIQELWTTYFVDRQVRAALTALFGGQLRRDHQPTLGPTVPGTNALCCTVAAQQITTLIEGGIPPNIAKSRTSKP